MLKTQVYYFNNNNTFIILKIVVFVSIHSFKIPSVIYPNYHLFMISLKKLLEFFIQKNVKSFLMSFESCY